MSLTTGLPETEKSRRPLHDVPPGCGEDAVAVQGSPAALAAFERALPPVVEQMEKIRRAFPTSVHQQLQRSVVGVQFERFRAVAQKMQRDMEVYAPVVQRMKPRERVAYRHLTLRQIKQRFDEEDRRHLHVEAALRHARRRPGVVAARPREQGRGRSRVTRAGPSDDPADSDPPLACGRLEVAG